MEEKAITVTKLEEDGTDGVKFMILLSKAKCHFKKEDDGFIWMYAPNLRHGSVRIKESLEDLLKQTDSIYIIS